MDLMRVLPTHRMEQMRVAGLWGDRSLLDEFDQTLAANPAKIAIVSHRAEVVATQALTFAQLDDAASRLALELASLGVERGDVVSFQLPNWWQFTALHLACLRVGAISNPLMPIFRERELKFMLGLAESRVLVVPKAFRGFDYAGMAHALAAELPLLRRVMVVGEDPLFDDVSPLSDAQRMQARALFPARRLGADDVVQVLYTSGTTGEPKGVMHTSNTLLAHLKPSAKRLGLTAGDVVFCPTPLAHQLGFMYGLVVPMLLGSKVVLQDTWNPQVGAELIEREHVSFAMGSTPFLADLADLAHADFDTLRLFFSAGAPIPRALVQRATQQLGAQIVSGWGMTENGAPTMARPGDPDEKIFGTDGVRMEGMEVRVVDGAGTPVPTNLEGRLQVRGASNFVGYLKRPELYGVDAEGWFDTGDLARMDPDGYIRISGRSKDVIIRGGENVPVVEVEEALYKHPSVAAVAVVAMPDARLGERACAFVQTKPGAGFSFEDMIRHLTDQKMARPYFPERLEVIDAIPRTPSGKIQKFKLREHARGLLPIGAPDAATGLR